MLTLALMGSAAIAPARAADESPAPHTRWAASVRAALTSRAHHIAAWTQHGMASWYGRHFHGRRTSSGAVFNAGTMTAAHPSLPLGTRLLVTSEDTGRSVIVTVNDRGPFNSRIIDLSQAAAAKIGMLGRGTAHVTLARLPTSPPSATQNDGVLEVAEADPSDTSSQAIASAAPQHAFHHQRKKTRRHR